jgi:hypothetical protein
MRKLLDEKGLWVASGVLFAVAVAAGLVIALSEGGSNDKASLALHKREVSHFLDTRPPAPPTSAPTLPSSVEAAGGKRVGKVSHALPAGEGTAPLHGEARSWYEQHASDVFSAFAQEDQEIGKYSQEHDLTSLANACRALATTMRSAQGEPLPPGSELISDWGVFVEDGASAARNCQEAISGNDASLLTQVPEETSKASLSLEAMLPAIRAAHS